MTTEPRPTTESGVQGQFITRRLRLAGLLIVAGILIQGLTLVWNHPLSFIAFLGIGGLAVFAGIAIYLFALVSPRQP